MVSFPLFGGVASGGPASGVASRVLVGFTGSRSLPASFGPLVSGVVSSVLAGGRLPAVGCAAGADLLVRSACPGAVVFWASSPVWSRQTALVPAARLSSRSVALVRAVAASGSGAGFVGFVSSACPAGLVPSSSSSACFSGSGSGSWASLALAAGLGLPVVVFPFAGSAAWLPLSWGEWVPAAPSGAWAGGFRLVPAAVRLPGF